LELRLRHSDSSLFLIILEDQVPSTMDRHPSIAQDLPTIREDMLLSEDLDMPTIREDMLLSEDLDMPTTRR